MHGNVNIVTIEKKVRAIINNSIIKYTVCKLIYLKNIKIQQQFYFQGIAVLEKLCQLKIHLEVPDIDEEESKVTYSIIKI